MNIPSFLDKDDYLLNPIMRRFLKEHNIDFVENRADYIKAIEDYAKESVENEQKVKDWIYNCAKEGSKEFCYRKITGIKEEDRVVSIIEGKIRGKYPNCPMKSILDYTNTKDRNLIDYKILTNDNGQVEKIELVYSSLMLYGEIGKAGDKTVLPIFVEVYLKEGIIVSRVKAKSTLFYCYEDEQIIMQEHRANTMECAISAIDDIIGIFDFYTERDKKVVKKENSEMLYGLYEEYTETPKEVHEKVDEMRGLNRTYVDKLFEELGLDVRNKEKAMMDMNILVEKYVAINGNNENVFKEDRDAYLIKVSADDDIELTKIDTASAKAVPLQCTEMFYDSKKSVKRSKTCGKLNIMYKRTKGDYLGNKPIPVQFGTDKNYGYFKTIHYAEEVDIQNVIQAICKHYR